MKISTRRSLPKANPDPWEPDWSSKVVRKDGTLFPAEIGLGVTKTRTGTVGVAFVCGHHRAQKAGSGDPPARKRAGSPV